MTEGTNAPDLKLTDNSIKVLERRYLIKDDQGKVVETRRGFSGGWQVPLPLLTKITLPRTRRWRDSPRDSTR